MEEPVQQPLFPVESETEKEPVIIASEVSSVKKKSSGGDCIFTQFLLSAVFAAAVFSLKWIHPAFQTALLEQYQTKLYAPAEPFFTQLLEQLERWVH